MIGLPPTTISAAQRVGRRVDVVGQEVRRDVAPHVAHRADGRVEEPLGQLVEALGRAAGRAAARRPARPRLPVTRLSICSNQYTSVPWRPMFPPVPMWAMAVGASAKAWAVAPDGLGVEPGHPGHRLGVERAR